MRKARVTRKIREYSREIVQDNIKRILIQNWLEDCGFSFESGDFSEWHNNRIIHRPTQTTFDTSMSQERVYSIANSIK